ncbi:MAG: (2Fe-2S)-binding protein [Rubricoccaceae bacterium]
MSSVYIDRCYCFAQPFAALADVAAATGASCVADLQREAAAQGCAFGQRCRLCHPYVRRMLRTGQTVFHRIVTEDDEPPRVVGDVVG